MVWNTGRTDRHQLSSVVRPGFFFLAATARTQASYAARAARQGSCRKRPPVLAWGVLERIIPGFPLRLALATRRLGACAGVFQPHTTAVVPQSFLAESTPARGAMREPKGTGLRS
jgi:hypothetical protein